MLLIPTTHHKGFFQILSLDFNLKLINNLFWKFHKSLEDHLPLQWDL